MAKFCLNFRLQLLFSESVESSPVSDYLSMKDYISDDDIIKQMWAAEFRAVA